MNEKCDTQWRLFSNNVLSMTVLSCTFLHGKHANIWIWLVIKLDIDKQPMYLDILYSTKNIIWKYENALSYELLIAM